MEQRLVAINNWRKRLAKFKFREDEILTRVSNHIIQTYDAHYSMNKIQSTEFIVDAGHGEGFCLETLSNMPNATVRKMVKTKTIY